jgi:glycosyltransferase involved in cell wall biosynthesis
VVGNLPNCRIAELPSATLGTLGTSEKVSFVVVNFRTYLFTRLCLNSIRRYYPNHEIVVVDNSFPPDRSSEYLRQRQDLCLIVNSHVEQSHGEGLDRGLAAASGEYVLTLDSDCHLTSGGLIEHLLREGAAVVGCGLCHRVHPSIALYHRPTLLKHRLSFRPRPRSALEHWQDLPESSRGTFHEHTFEPGEYIDWFCRARGYPVILLANLGAYVDHFWIGSPRVYNALLYANQASREEAQSEHEQRRQRMIEFFSRPEILELLNADPTAPPLKADQIAGLLEQHGSPADGW